MKPLMRAGRRWWTISSGLARTSRTRTIGEAHWWLVGRRVIVMKRSLSPGFAGIDNDLFYMDNTLMFFGDAKSSMSDLVREVRELA